MKRMIPLILILLLAACGGDPAPTPDGEVELVFTIVNHTGLTFTRMYVTPTEGDPASPEALEGTAFAPDMVLQVTLSLSKDNRYFDILTYTEDDTLWAYAGLDLFEFSGIELTMDEGGLPLAILS